MHAGVRRVVPPVYCRDFCTAALLLSVISVVIGCRSESIGAGAEPTLALSGLEFSVGDTLAFDVWDLDQFGSVVLSTRTRLLWSVLSVSDSIAGYGGVTTLSVLPAPGYPPAIADTLHFRFLPTGDIYQYGFIAQAVRRGGGSFRSSSWDRIAAFSLPTNATWIAGVADSAGLDTLQGIVVGDQGYFESTVNGVPTVFQGYGVSLTSMSLQYQLSASNVPPAFLFIQEQTPLTGNGFIQSLVSIITRRHGQ